MKNQLSRRLESDSELYIYYCEGRLPPQAGIRDKAFIGNWEEDGFSFFFFRSPAEKTVHRLISTYPELRLLDSYQMTYAQWQGGQVAPVQVGRFRLRPPWIDTAPDDGTVEIILDPGVVFGTGTHPTTRDCLEAIHRVCTDGGVTRMLDLGTGTGVLALAAIKLGCREAVAVDFNFLAAETSLENVRRNDMDQQILVINAQAEACTGYRADLLVANIHYDVMHRIVRTAGFLEKKWFILSGLLRSDAKRISDFLANQPVTIVKHGSRDGIWHTFLGKTGKS